MEDARFSKATPSPIAYPSDRPYPEGNGVSPHRPVRFTIGAMKMVSWDGMLPICFRLRKVVPDCKVQVID